MPLIGKKRPRGASKAIVGALFDIGMEYNVIFSPLFTFSDEWEKGIFTEFPIYQEISRDGSVVS